MFNEWGLELVAIEDPVQRIQRLMTWHEQSMVLYYMKLADRLVQKGPPDLGEFAPPDSESLLRHLRLSGVASSPDQFHQSIELAARILVDEEGVDEAFKRLAGLPRPLPHYLVQSVKALPYDEQRVFIKTILHQSLSMLGCFHLVCLLVQVSSGAPLFARLARYIIAWQLSEENPGRFESQLAILRWVNAKFYHWPAAHAWPAHVRLAMVWAHGNQLISLLQDAGADPAWIASQFGRAADQILTEVWDTNNPGWLDVAHPRRVHYASFTVAGLSYALGDDCQLLSRWGLQDKVHSLIMREINGQEVLDVSIMQDHARASNLLGSFLTRGERLVETLLASTDPNSKLESPQSLVENAIASLLLDSSDFLSWAAIHAILGDLPLYEHLKEDFKAIVRKTNFAELVQGDTWQGLIVLETFAAQLIYLEAPDLYTEIAGHLRRIGRHLAQYERLHRFNGAESTTDHDILEYARSTLFEIALAVCGVPGGEMAPAERFAEIVEQLVTEWPSAGAWAKHVTHRLLEGLPAQQSRPLYRVLIWLRAYNV
ncbi:MAG: hypothetical protein IT318_22755 [Anaerolineales bacterium]|nr:hypothetical protein [Anaerolineales bacterium]